MVEKAQKEQKPKAPKITKGDLVEKYRDSCKTIQELATKAGTTVNSARWYVSKRGLEGFPRVKKTEE